MYLPSAAPSFCRKSSLSLSNLPVRFDTASDDHAKQKSKKYASPTLVQHTATDNGWARKHLTIAVRMAPVDHGGNDKQWQRQLPTHLQLPRLPMENTPGSIFTPSGSGSRSSSSDGVVILFRGASTGIGATAKSVGARRARLLRSILLPEEGAVEAEDKERPLCIWPARHTLSPCATAAPLHPDLLSATLSPLHRLLASPR